MLVGGRLVAVSGPSFAKQPLTLAVVASCLIAGCGEDAAPNSAYCDVAKQFDEAITAGVGLLDENASRAEYAAWFTEFAVQHRDLIRTLRERAPGEIRDDAATLAGAYEEVAQGEGVYETFDVPDVQRAGERVDSFTQAECDIEDSWG